MRERRYERLVATTDTIPPGGPAASRIGWRVGSRHAKTPHFPEFIFIAPALLTSLER
jgi:hypothetical protein